MVGDCVSANEGANIEYRFLTTRYRLVMSLETGKESCFKM